VSIHPQALLAFVGSYFMSFSFFTTRHVGRYFLMDFGGGLLNGFVGATRAKEQAP
jgi:hypothetical protein